MPIIEQAKTSVTGSKEINIYILPDEGLKVIVAKKLSKIRQNKYYKKQIKKKHI